MRRSPQRAAATALALTIGLTVVCAVAVTASSTKASVADLVRGGNRADLIISPLAQSGGASPAVADILRKRDDVATVVEMRYTGARVNGDSTALAGVSTAGIADVADLGIASGSLDDFTGGTMLLGTKSADQARPGPR